MAADDRQVSVLISLDHSLLTEHLKSEFGVTDTPLDWLCSYLGDREQ